MYHNCSSWTLAKKRWRPTAPRNSERNPWGRAVILRTNRWCLISLLELRQVGLKRKRHVSGVDWGRARTCSGLGLEEKDRIQLDWCLWTVGDGFYLQLGQCMTSLLRYQTLRIPATGYETRGNSFISTTMVDLTARQKKVEERRGAMERSSSSDQIEPEVKLRYFPSYN